MFENWLSYRQKRADNSDTERPELRPANENPWYCLATVFGEQPIGHFDRELAEKNRTVWERWINGAMTPEQRNQFARRTSLTLPEPAAPVDFSHMRFDGRVSFSGFRFTRPVDFRSATFSGDANFVGAQFHDKINFNSATFSGDTQFDGAQFHTADPNFEAARFSNGVHFRYVGFTNANFRSATFSGAANFNRARFSGEGSASFRSATFSSETDFGSAEFLSAADFGSATFSKTASFNAAAFNIASFNGATFSSPITFINAKFNGSTIFAFARFEAQPPDFRGATMHEATEWHGVTWPKPPKNKLDAQKQVYVYERLKQEMERLKKHEDEQKFFRKELRARRGLLRGLSGEWLLNLLYKATSDYGNSFIRPLLWLLVVFAVGTAILARAPLYCGAPMPIKLAAKLSFANIFVFLPDRREIMMNAKMVECLSNTTQAVSAAQSLVSVVLLFLLGLALRNRFRMR